MSTQITAPEDHAGRAQKRIALAIALHGIAKSHPDGRAVELIDEAMSQYGRDTMPPDARDALQAFCDAYEAQWGDVDVWLDFIAKAHEQAKATLAKYES